MAEWLASDYLLDAVEMRSHGKDVLGIHTKSGEEYLVVKPRHPRGSRYTPKGKVYQVLPRPSWWPPWWYDSLGPKLKKVAEGLIKQSEGGGGYPLLIIYNHKEVGERNWQVKISGILETWRLGKSSVYRVSGEGHL